MNDDYYKNSAEDTKVPKATTEGTTKIWLWNFNPRSYENFIIIFNYNSNYIHNILALYSP